MLYSSYETVHSFVKSTGKRYVILMVGPENSGKTQWAYAYDYLYPECVNLSPEIYFRDKNFCHKYGYVPSEYPSYKTMCHAHFHRRMREVIQEGESAIVDRHNMTSGSRLQITEIFEGYVKVFVVMGSPNDCSWPHPSIDEDVDAIFYVNTENSSHFGIASEAHANPA